LTYSDKKEAVKELFKNALSSTIVDSYSAVFSKKTYLEETQD